MRNLSIFEDTIRKFISIGSGIDSMNVVPGLTSDAAPDSGLFASAHIINQRVMSRNNHNQFVGATQSFTVDVVACETTWDVQFFRDGALAAAFDFRDYANSETGINWANSANVDGRIRALNVYAGGDGYENGVRVYMHHGPGHAGNVAWAICETKPGGVIVRARMQSYGTNYYDIPAQSIDPEDNPDGYSYMTIQYWDGTTLHPTAGTGASIAPRGFGFSVAGEMPVMRIDDEIGGEYEERAAITLRTHHVYLHKDANSGRVEQIISDDPVPFYLR